MGDDSMTGFKGDDSNIGFSGGDSIFGLRGDDSRTGDESTTGSSWEYLSGSIGGILLVFNDSGSIIEYSGSHIFSLSYEEFKKKSKFEDSTNGSSLEYLFGSMRDFCSVYLG